MSEEQIPPENPPEVLSEPPRFAAAARAFGRGLLRLLLILAIVAVVAVIVYLVVPLAYNGLIMPVRDTSARLQAIETQNVVDQANLTETLNGLQNRLNQLEIDRAAQSAQQAGLQGQLDSLRQSQSTISQSLGRLDQLEILLKNLQTQQAGGSTRLDSLQATLSAPPVQVLGMLREVQTLKVLNLLLRAHLNLAENNYGLAKTDLQSARNVILTLRDSLSESERPGLNPWITRLDLAIGELPASPVLAAGDLEIAYELISSGILPPTPTPGASLGEATPAAFATETLAPFLIGPSETATPQGASSTPTRSPSPSPSATAAPSRTATATPTATE